MLTKLETFTRIINQFYTEGAHICNASDGTLDDTADDAPEPKVLTESEEDKLYRDIYSGKVTPDRLPVNLYTSTGEFLSEGINKGLNEAAALGLGSIPDPKLYDALRDNAFIFSGAKTFQQVRVMSDFIVDDDGNVRTFAQFREKAREVFGQFNVNWLKTEYNTALNGSQMASRWDDIIDEAEEFPLLKYVTRGDGRVRPEHKALDQVIRPVDDVEFWNKYYPTNGWNCRCGVQKLSDFHEDKITNMKKVKLPEIAEEFSFNVGVSRAIYSPKHPFFAIEKQYQSAAKHGFNLPPPKKQTPTVTPEAKKNGK